MENTRFLLVGTVSNVEQKLPGDVGRILGSLKKIGRVDTFLVESDSKDNTLRVLKELGSKDKTFGYESMGELGQDIPNRVERIRFCRNRYVEYIRKNYSVTPWDYIIVADLDGMNSAITPKKITSSIRKSSSWDACFSNQTFGYYDLYALRAKGWVEADCFEELDKLKELAPFTQKRKSSLIGFFSAFMHFDKLRDQAIYSMMRFLRGDLVPVESAFGGFAIYKPEVFLKFDYSSSGESLKGKCEHLDLHAKCVASGLNLLIDPKLTNCHWNEYNLNRIKVVRFIREFKKYLNSLK